VNQYINVYSIGLTQPRFSGIHNPGGIQHEPSFSDTFTHFPPAFPEWILGLLSYLKIGLY